MHDGLRRSQVILTRIATVALGAISVALWGTACSDDARPRAAIPGMAPETPPDSAVNSPGQGGGVPQDDQDGDGVPDQAGEPGPGNAAEPVGSDVASPFGPGVIDAGAAGLPFASPFGVGQTIDGGTPQPEGTIIVVF